MGLPIELVAVINDFYGNVAAESRRFIKNNTRVHLRFDDNHPFYEVRLQRQNITSLHGWDFDIYDCIVELKLKQNQIERINDQHTSFCDVCCFMARENSIKMLDLRNTNVEDLILDRNALTGKSFMNNEVLLPNRIKTVSLMENPIGSISDYEFSSRSGWLDMTRCNITKLQNVVFNTKSLILCDNPLQLLQNVSFKNVRIVYMTYCNITLSILEAFDMKFVNDDEMKTTLLLGGNSFTLQQLKDAAYKFPSGLDFIHVDDASLSIDGEISIRDDGYHSDSSDF